MSRADQIDRIKRGLAQASAALDNARDVIREILDDVLVVVAHPALLEAQHEATEALHCAETALAHLERIMPTPPPVEAPGDEESTTEVPA